MHSRKGYSRSLAEQQTAAALADQLTQFLKAFKDRDGNYKYFERINDMMASNSVSLVVDYIDLDSHNPALATEITHKPDEYLEAFSIAVLSILREIHPDYEQEIREKIRVRIGNYTVQKGLREINADLIDKMVSVSGMVVRSSEVKPLARKVAYHCTSCAEVFDAQLKGLVLKKPQKCPKCGEREFDMDPENSIFIDFQMVRLQELPEDLPAGQLPHYVEVTVMGDLVDQCRPGDRIILTGIIRIEQEQLAPHVKTSLFRLRMEGNNIEYLGGRAGSKDTRSAERIMISAEDERQIRTIASKPDAYDKLIASFAPHIYGHWEIKESILLLIVGSVTKKVEDGSTRRGDINVLLVGDPGCLRKSTKVILADGGMVELGSLGSHHLERLQTRMLNDEGSDIATVFHKYEKQNVIEIVTESGKSIVGTHNHPLMTRGGWKRVDEMKPGDELKMVTHIPCSITDYAPAEFRIVTRTRNRGKVPSVVDEKLAAFMGFLTGDGWCRSNGYRIGFIVSQREEELLRPLLQMGEELFGLEARLTKKGYAGQVVMMSDGRQIVRTMYTTNVEYDSKNLAEMFSFLREKRVPQSIFISPNGVVASYLKWLFEADGTVFCKGRGSRGVQLKSRDVGLLRDVQLLLLRFGIHSRVIIHSTGNSLVIRRGPAIVKYAKDIGFASRTKQQRLSEAVKWALEFRRNRNHDEEYEKVVRVIFRADPEDVYDIEIPSSHKFIANGIVSHNTAKSEMLKYAAKIAPRGLYTSGRGTTAAGLTAAVIRDRSGIYMLEAGAVVLGDQGLVSIDEFDKIKPEDRSALHEVMEQQTCSVAKGGIVATLNARTSILSAANPMYGKYDPYKNITENVNLPIPLLTRFDLIFIVRDLPEKEKDNLIASHILEIHRDIEHAVKPAIEIDLFSKYLSFAKQIEPVLTQQAIDIIRNYYMDMRKVESEGMITVTPRQLEGLIRLATARARLLLKDKVEEDDAKRAIYLVEKMLSTAGVDVNTGKLDVGVLYGKPQSEVSKSKMFMDVFKGLSGSDNNDVEEKTLLEDLLKTGKFTDEGDARKYFERAKREGQIYERKPGFWAKA
jgi:DNA replicative helicase MCM subunit Mcm2 (Cdc46/Mcm family)